MKIKKRHFVAVGLLVAAIALCFVTFRLNEPIVRGHPVTYWAQEAGLPFRDDMVPNLQEKAEIDAAFDEMDERSIKWFISELAWKPAPLESKINDYAIGWNHFKPFPQADDNRVYAAFALTRLGSRATNAIPALEVARHSGDPVSGMHARGAAIAALVMMHSETLENCAVNAVNNSNSGTNDYLYALCYLGTNSVPALSALVRVLETSTNDVVKRSAVMAIATVHSRPELSLPPLIAMLADTNQRGYVLAWLPDFGKTAKPAWSNLVECLRDPSERVRAWTTNALWRIDPEAARPLGITGPGVIQD